LHNLSLRRGLSYDPATCEAHILAAHHRRAFDPRIVRDYRDWDLDCALAGAGAYGAIHTDQHRAIVRRQDRRGGRRGGNGIIFPGNGNLFAGGEEFFLGKGFRVDTVIPGYPAGALTLVPSKMAHSN